MKEFDRLNVVDNRPSILCKASNIPSDAYVGIIPIAKSVIICCGEDINAMREVLHVA
jgi:hypothetical protein